MSTPKVSICVAYYNRSEYVEECIGSLLKQDYDNFEVVVVNDGSSDKNTKVLLDGFTDKRLKVIHQNNTGFVGAMNNAINNSTGEYIAIMGAGDTCSIDRIRKQAQLLQSDEKIGIVSCLFDNIAFGGEDQGTVHRRDYPDTVISAANFLSGNNPIGHGEVMFTRKMFDLVGGYRPYFKFSQDLDLWLRMVDHCDVKILRERLYERRLFASDGVSTNLKKLFLQKYLAEFARQCYIDRKELGFDFVEKFGVQAGFFKRPNKILGQLATSYSLIALKEMNFLEAKEFIGIASGETKTIRFYIVNSLVSLRSTSIGERLLKAILFIYLKVKP